MQIQKIQNNHNIKFNNFVYSNRRQNTLNINNICFQGGKQGLVPINIDSFEKESSKIIYSKIQKYL